MLKKFLAVAAFTATVALTGSASATVITSMPGGTVVPFPVIGAPTFGFGAGPHVFGPGISWTSGSTNSVFGFDSGYGFASNGFWGSLVMAGTNDATSAMNFNFTTPVTAVGGFVNYSPDYGSAVMSVYDVSDTLIESFVLNFLIPYGADTGLFYGFSEATPIARFELSGAYVGITDLTISSAVPEPSTWAMMLIGFAGLGFLAQRKLKAKPVAA